MTDLQRSRTFTWLLLVLALALGVFLIWFYPHQAAQSLPESTSAVDRHQIENDHRATGAQIFLGIGLLIGVWLTHRRVRAIEKQAESAARQAVTAEQGHVTERFTRAIEHLGKPGVEYLAIRLGGIFALERIMRDSADDFFTVQEVLAAFIREESNCLKEFSDEAIPSAPHAPSRIRADIQAALTVLGRNPPATDTHGARIDLSGAHLSGVDLENAHLEGAVMKSANLTNANLKEANLSDANLEGANLDGAILRRAHLEEVDLSEARLEGADLMEANLESADLERTHLVRAVLYAANLVDVWLVGANLKQADLRDANLENSKLIEANLEAANLQNAKLVWSQLSQTSMKGANLEDASLEGSSLNGVLLHGANLAGTRLAGVDLRRALGLDQSQVSQASTSPATLLPEGLSLHSREDA